MDQLAGREHDVELVVAELHDRVVTKVASVNDDELVHRKNLDPFDSWLTTSRLRPPRGRDKKTS